MEAQDRWIFMTIVLALEHLGTRIHATQHRMCFAKWSYSLVQIIENKTHAGGMSSLHRAYCPRTPQDNLGDSTANCILSHRSSPAQVLSPRAPQGNQEHSSTVVHFVLQVQTCIGPRPRSPEDTPGHNSPALNIVLQDPSFIGF